MLEAKLIGLKEGFKVAIVWLIFYSYLIKIDKIKLIKKFNYAIVTTCLITILTPLSRFGVISVEYLGNLIEMSFAFFLILGSATLFHISDTNLFGKKKVIDIANPGHLGVMVYLITFMFFVPDGMGSVLYLQELGLMKETGSLTYLYALLGLGVGVLIIFIVVRFYKPYWIGEYFDLPQLFLFLAIVKLLGGGIEGVTELSLIPSVQQGFMKFIHDFIHQTLVLLMVPDHPLLKATVWDFIAVFFGSGLASILSLILLLFFPLMFLYYRLFKPVPEPEVQKNVERRKIKSRLISERRKKALPVLFFIGLILIAWFSQRGETVSELYNPVPSPLVEEGGYIEIPLKDPLMNLTDGAIHKFVLVHEGEEIRLMIIRKPDNTLSVSLDACEICPPEGYSQRMDHVVCIYCETPIHLDTLGQTGGCNPIPLAFRVDGSQIKIELNEILDKWGFVMSGEGKR